jgi:RNA polymerase sigma-70 factor (ECF subfamily)
VNLNNKNIAEQLKTDDGSVFEQLFQSYFVSLVKYASEIVKDQDLAEEIVENTFVRLWESRLTIQINTSVQQYLYRSVYNSCLNYFKHIDVENRYKLFFHHHIAVGDTERLFQYFPMNNLLHEELQQLIERTVKEFPDQCKKVFEYSRYGNLTNDEIAKKLDISVNTVKTHIGRALSKLRVALKDYLAAILFC